MVGDEWLVHGLEGRVCVVDCRDGVFAVDDGYGVAG